MELREFMTETLIAIQEGVAEAIRRWTEGKGTGVINPVWDAKDGKVDWKDYERAVEFDVAVTATDKAGSAGTGGIKVFTVVDVGAEGSKSSEPSTVSRIKFSIPIVPSLQRADRHPN